MISIGGQGQTLAEKASGPPQVGLPMDNYEQITAFKLKDAKILWYNKDLLEELGFKIVSTGLTEEQKRELLDIFAYSSNEKLSHELVDTEKTKILYADYYGGNGLNGNYGSGRAASIGQFQIKGMPTPMIRKDSKSNDHNSGTANILDGFREAIWGSILNKIMPHGANQTLLIIETGAMSQTKYGVSIPGALVVRKLPLRPANFLINYNRPDKEAEILRVKKNLKILPFLLPLPQDFSANNDEERISVGFRTLITRTAEQYSFSYAHRIYHGALSTSNLELNGSFLDFGTMTTLDGYQKAMAYDLKPFGNTTIFEDNLFFILADEWGKYLPANLARELPSKTEIHDLFQKTFTKTFNLEMVKQIGIPQSILQDLESQEAVQKLGSILSKIAFTGPDQLVDIKFRVSKSQNDYNMLNIFKVLSHEAFSDSHRLDHMLMVHLSKDSLRTQLVKAYVELMNIIKKQAEINNYAISDIKNEILKEAERFQQLRDDLFRGPANFLKVISSYVKNKFSSTQTLFQNFIDGIINRNVSTFKSVMSYTPEMHSIDVSIDTEQNKIDRTVDTSKFMKPSAIQQDIKYIPESGKWFKIKSAWVPEFWLDVAKSKFMIPAEISDDLIKIKNNVRYFRFFIHPESEEFYKELLAQVEVVEEHEAKATSSSRTVWIRKLHNETPEYYAKLSLDKVIGGAYRGLPRSETVSSIGHSDYIRQNSLLTNSNLQIFPEVLGVIPKKWTRGGQIIRLIPPEIKMNKTNILPLFSLYASTSDQQTLLEQLADKEGLSLEEFTKIKIIEPFLRIWFLWLVKGNVIIEPHAQNTLIEVTKNMRVTGRFFYRDHGGVLILANQPNFNHESVRNLPVFENFETDYHQSFIEKTLADNLRTYFQGGFLFGVEKLISKKSKIKSNELTKYMEGKFVEIYNEYKVSDPTLPPIEKLMDPEKGKIKALKDKIYLNLLSLTGGPLNKPVILKPSLNSCAILFH